MASQSWLPIPAKSPFSLANIPFGIITTSASPEDPHPAIAIGDHALDLYVFDKNNGFSGLPSVQSHRSVFAQPTLNAFAALPSQIRREVRRYLQSIFTHTWLDNITLKDNLELQKAALFPLNDVKTHMPMQIGDYTDFYAGSNHAENVSVMFNNSMPPNYTHLPVGYHGRASSVVVSGTPIRRPWGQYLSDPAADPKVPTFAPCRLFDYELEMGAFVCRENKLGEPVPIADGQAESHIFGVVLMNDWSARDIQGWEMQPLGPFNSKNLGTTISPWIVTIEALEPFLTEGLRNYSQVQRYLDQGKEKNVYDIRLEVDITPKESGKTKTVSNSNAKHLLWSFPQMMAHHTITGCPMRVGDLIGSGTISGDRPGSEGCLLEQSKGGKVAVKLQDGEERKFLEDGDTVTFRGIAGDKDGALVGFGECVGTVQPALKF